MAWGAPGLEFHAARDRVKFARTNARALDALRRTAIELPRPAVPQTERSKVHGYARVGQRGQRHAARRAGRIAEKEAPRRLERCCNRQQGK